MLKSAAAGNIILVLLVNNPKMKSGCLSNVFGLKLQSGNHEKYLFNNEIFSKFWKKNSHFLGEKQPKTKNFTQNKLNKDFETFFNPKAIITIVQIKFCRAKILDFEE